MTNQIKNYILEGEKEFEEKFIPEYVKMYRNEIDIENLAVPMKIDGLKQFISSRQISLIKMIVDEYSSIPSYSCNTYSNEGDRILPLMVQKADVDTISSKLKELTDGK